MTREELFSEIDAATDLRLATWVPVQEAYRAQHGRYMQVVCSHSTIPADGNATTPDRLADSPTDQAESLAALGFAADPLTAAFQADTHGGPDGLGWTLRLFVMWDGVMWTKAIGHGSHAENFAWRECVSTGQRLEGL